MRSGSAGIPPRAAHALSSPRRAVGGNAQFFGI
jgi:hypothetical protein